MCMVDSKHCWISLYLNVRADVNNVTVISLCKCLIQVHRLIRGTSKVQTLDP